MRAGALTISVGSSSVGRGVSVRVGTICVAGAVDVAAAVGAPVGASRDWNAGGSVAGASVGGASVSGACVGAGAALAHDAINKVKISRITIRRIMHTHFRIHAGQQAESVIRDRICPVARSAICTSILSSTTAVNARVFPSGDQNGVSARPYSKRVTCFTTPLG